MRVPVTAGAPARTILRIGLAWLLAAAAVPMTASAQDASRWGVSASFTPTQSWNTNATFSKYLFANSGPSDLRSSDFSIGLVRGRELGGDWGVSLVRRSIADGSSFTAESESCTSTTCTPYTRERSLTRNVTYTGVELHKFVSFVTIRQRVQLGMNFAGGVGSYDGDVERHETDFIPVFNGKTVTIVPTEVVTNVPMKEYVSISPFPIGKIEAAVAGLVAPGFKVRWSAGFSFPGHQVFTLTGVYLFGHK
jgi:hypothetical protein